MYRFACGSSLFTLFQVATGDAWASIVTRGLLALARAADLPYSVGFVMAFFVSYVLVVGLVLMNIVVAVLLDEFISTVAREKAEVTRRLPPPSNAVSPFLEEPAC